MPETRCGHGFLRSVAPCVECDSAERGIPVPAEELPRVSDRGRRTYCCTTCGQRGHSKRTCAKNRPDSVSTKLERAKAGLRALLARVNELEAGLA